MEEGRNRRREGVRGMNGVGAKWSGERGSYLKSASMQSASTQITLKAASRQPRKGRNSSTGSAAGRQNPAPPPHGRLCGETKTLPGSSLAHPSRE
jgi:hypothetical protein